uniref:RNA polymerase sigma-F factor n=1 Tax=Lygus hesperus TaxID=30085 RepID=A0A0A9XJQ6_LYGHE
MWLIVPVLLFSSSLVASKVFTACELAQKLNDRFTDQITKGLASREEVSKYYTDIPLLVCIAGYHNFSTSNVVVTDDRVAHNGIFGIVPHDLKGDPALLLDDNIDLDVKTFLEKVLYVAGSLYRNENNRNFYDKLCTYPEVEYVSCYLNNYVFGRYRVPIPLNPNLLYKTYQNRTIEVPW